MDEDMVKAEAVGDHTKMAEDMDVAAEDTYRGNVIRVEVIVPLMAITPIPVHNVLYQYPTTT